MVCCKYLMHQSFVTMGPHIWGRMGDSWGKVRGNYFFYCPGSAGEMMGF